MSNFQRYIDGNLNQEVANTQVRQITGKILLFLAFLILTTSTFAVDNQSMSREKLFIGKQVISSWIDEVAETKETILVATYKLTSKKALDGLIAAHNRGVEVRIILDGAKAKKNKSLAFKAVIAGLDVVFWPSNYQGELHTKFYIFDNRSVILGSFNLTESAAEKNVELLYRIDDKESIKDFTDEWQKLYDSSLPVNPTNTDE